MKLHRHVPAADVECRMRNFILSDTYLIFSNQITVSVCHQCHDNEEVWLHSEVLTLTTVVESVPWTPTVKWREFLRSSSFYHLNTKQIQGSQSHAGGGGWELWHPKVRHFLSLLAQISLFFKYVLLLLLDSLKRSSYPHQVCFKHQTLSLHHPNRSKFLQENLVPAGL